MHARLTLLLNEVSEVFFLRFSIFGCPHTCTLRSSDPGAVLPSRPGRGLNGLNPAACRNERLPIFKFFVMPLSESLPN
jgi:hypothetical protein